jgi:hypothetical protein
MNDRMAGIKFMDAVFYAVSFFGLYSAALFMWGEIHNQGTEKLVQPQTNGSNIPAEKPEISVYRWRP